MPQAFLGLQVWASNQNPGIWLKQHECFVQLLSLMAQTPKTFPAHQTKESVLCVF